MHSHTKMQVYYNPSHSTKACTVNSIVSKQEIISHIKDENQPLSIYKQKKEKPGEIICKKKKTLCK